jgi:hypothetical protein
MKTPAAAAFVMLALALAPVLLPADPDDEPAQPARNEPATQLVLTQSQQQAVGIRLERPLALTSAPQIAAFGTVLDPVTLVTDMGRVQSTRLVAAAAAADAARLEHLYHEDAQASLKALQAAQAQSAEAAAQARAAALAFSLQWGPFAALSAAEQRALLEALTSGQQLLLRAEVPAQQLADTPARRALVEVDGVSVDARVLGPLRRSDAAAHSSGWLLQLERAPQGLGPGARTAVRLQVQATKGLMVPTEALVYAAQGAYVYRRQRSGAADSFHYEAVAVRPLARVGSAWLVEGLAPADQVVVQGAGVLWSLQGIGSFSAAEQEHD